MVTRPSIVHGSPGGAKAHRRRGENACAKCLKAEAAAIKKWRDENPVQREREREANRAAGYAATELIANHKDEYDRLYAKHLARIRGVKI